jgi:hypothetical protein
MDQPAAVLGIPGVIKLCDQLSFNIANLGQLDKILADLRAQCSEQKSVLAQLQPLLAPESRASPSRPDNHIRQSYHRIPGRSHLPR